MLQWHSPGGIRGDEIFPKYLKINTEARMFYWQPPWNILVFLLQGNQAKMAPKHNKFLNSRKSYAIPVFNGCISPNGSAGGCFTHYFENPQI